MGISASVVSRVTGVNTEFRNFNLGQAQFLPQRIAVIGQGNTALAGYSHTKRTVTTEKEVGTIFGYGSPLHLVCRQLLPASENGVSGIPVTLYPLDDAGTGVAAAGNIGATGTAT